MILKVLRKGFAPLYSKSDINRNIDLNGQNASNLIYQRIISKEPFLLARIGATEFSCLTGYLQEQKGVAKYYDYIAGKLDHYRLDEKIIEQMSEWSGVFPAEKEIMELFSELTLKDIKAIDVLGVWLKENYLLGDNLNSATKIPLVDIEPYYHQQPWSKALENKTVLVIHPFAKSIFTQYQKRSKLFVNESILPPFNLKVLKSVQSIAGEDTGFQNWFDALDFMKNQINEIDFDIAIIGCGAYGLSLGAHIKRMGKQAIHMGGATQILFGIKGNRWDNHPIISNFYNENWIKPLPEETPERKDSVEDGCYW